MIRLLFRLLFPRDAQVRIVHEYRAAKRHSDDPMRVAEAWHDFFFQEDER